jgi:hypothetical protein
MTLFSGQSCSGILELFWRSLRKKWPDTMTRLHRRQATIQKKKLAEYTLVFIL